MSMVKSREVVHESGPSRREGAMMETRDRANRSTEELLRQDRYTPEELADLLEMDVNLIREAAFDHRLEAVIIDGDIVSISRAAALKWLNDRG
jgi:hypothetical protein